MSDPCPRCDEIGGFNGSFCKGCGYDIELEAADHAGEGADLGEFTYDDFVAGMEGPSASSGGVPWKVVLAGLIVASLLMAWKVPTFRGLGIVVAVVGAVIVALIYRNGGTVTGYGSSSAYLCDGCKYNDVRYCSRPERPNAKACPDYKGR